MANNEGWIKLHRQITECSIWEDKEPFDRRSAWIDLILMANHKDKAIIFDGKPLVVKRGQRITSIRELSERWGWYTKKTIEFLKLLETLQMITKESDKRKTLLTIVKYDVFQLEGNSLDNSLCHSSDNSTDNSTDIQTRMIKNDKKLNTKVFNNIGNFESEELDALFKDFVEMRKKLKKPLTDRAITLNINALTKIANGDVKKAIYVVEETIKHSWQSFYEPKNYKEKEIKEDDEPKPYSNTADIVKQILQERGRVSEM